MCHGVHDTPFSFLHFFVSSFFRFFIFSFLHFFHRISRMNRRHSCLSDYSRNFAELWPLANGSRPICSCCFCHADFADGADFSLWGLFCPTDFADIHRFFFVGIILSHRFRRWRRFFFVWIILSHRFHRYTQIFLCGTYSNSRGYLHRPDRSPLRKSVSNRLRRKPPNKFRVIR